MTARPDPFHTHVGDQVLAALHEAPLPMSTAQVQVAVGYGPRYGQLVYTTLTRLAAAGQAEKVSARTKPVFWRAVTAPVTLPPLAVTTDQDRRPPS